MTPERWSARLPLGSMRARLLAAFTLVVALPYALFGWAALQALDRYYRTRLQADMVVDADLIAAQAAGALVAGDQVELPALLTKPPPPLRSQVRVLLFDADGVLVSVSDPALTAFVGATLVEPGLEAALQGRAAQGAERSESAGGQVAYVARPVVSAGRVIGAIHLSYTLADIQNAQRWLSAAVVAATLAAAGLTSLVSLWITRSITYPLERLRAAADDIAGGMFTRRVAVEPPEEAAALARSFNRMAERLQRAEQARRESFAIIAHDVRTPLGSIHAATEALLAGAAERPELRERLLGGMAQQLRYLSRLADDLLRVAAYEGGGLVLRCQEIDVRPLAARALQAVEARAQARGVILEARLPEACPPVIADGDRVLEALFNLLDNALAYTPAGGQICLELEADPAHVWIHVNDTGPGLAEAALRAAGDGYWQGERSRAGTGAAGLHLGLGLHIVREIARAHGGALTAHNRDVGGAVFSFSLPLACSQPS